METMRQLVLLALFLNFARSAEWSCLTVAKGDYEPQLVPFYGFHSAVMTARVQLANDTSTYLFGPEEVEGARCQSSWNKLWGGGRCGYLNFHHYDSDRFVWRRHIGCIVFNGSRVAGERPNCPFRNQIQLAAYAYDDGNIPYQNASLLKQFDTTLEVGKEYGLRLDFLETSTAYSLYAGNSTLLERQVIQHRHCWGYSDGYILSLYFGGVCPAPQPVTVCYLTDDGLLATT